MHAYNRMEADQTDSIAVCATEEEWHGILQDLIYARYHMRLRSASADLISTLEGLGVHQ